MLCNENKNSFYNMPSISSKLWGYIKGFLEPKRNFCAQKLQNFFNFLGPEIRLQHNCNFWARKLKDFCNFWAQKLHHFDNFCAQKYTAAFPQFLGLNIWEMLDSISGPRNCSIMTISVDWISEPLNLTWLKSIGQIGQSGEF